MKKSLSVLAYAIVVCVLISSCKKDDPAPANSNTNNNNNTNAFYFNGTFDNVTYTQASAANANAFNNGIGSNSVGNYVDYANSDDYVYEFWEGSYWSKVNYQGGQFSEIDALTIKVHKSFNYVGGSDAPSEQDIKNIYAVGNHTNFSAASSGTDYPTTQGWDIVLIDASGTEWSSYKGIAAQTGSYIKIDSQQDVNMSNTRFLSLKGSMSCNLYDASGNVKVLKGSFYQLFSDYSVY